MYVDKLTDHGEFKELPNTNYKLHPFSAEKGGMNIRDEDGIVPGTVKNIIKKISGKLAKGEFYDISKTPAPSFLHHNYSHLAVMKNDCTYLHFLKKAADTDDVLQRMKYIIAFYISSHFINPTLIQCRIPLNPILGETYQREMPTGEKFYCE